MHLIFVPGERESQTVTSECIAQADHSGDIGDREKQQCLHQVELEQGGQKIHAFQRVRIRIRGTANDSEGQ